MIKIETCKDHPEANGRIPKPGEHGFTLTFPLADGDQLNVLCGRETLNRFAEIIGSMAIDDESERAEIP